MVDSEKKTCKTCGSTGTGNFCQSCGQNYLAKRITFKGMLSEAFHFFTHFDKGFPYTLKKLVVSPGFMQREYLDGIRSKYQKPFSMFFICATLLALAHFWFGTLLIRYFDSGDMKEAEFFHKYWVLLQIGSLPVVSFIIYLFFRDSKLNYAEIVVFQLYFFSFIFLMLILIQMLKFIFSDIQTRYIELPLIAGYTIFTNLNFFHHNSKPVIILKSILAITISFFFETSVQDAMVKIF